MVLARPAGAFFSTLLWILLFSLLARCLSGSSLTPSGSKSISFLCFKKQIKAPLQPSGLKQPQLLL